MRGNRSIDLFNSVVSEGSWNRDTAVAASPYSPPAPAKLLSHHELAEGLSELKTSDEDIEARCNRFASDYWPSIYAHGFPLPKPLFDLVRECLTRLCKTLTAEPLSPSNRGVYAQLSASMAACAISDVGLHTALILNMCLTLSQHDRMQTASREHLMSDILDSWMVISSMKQTVPTMGNPEFIFPDATQFAESVESLRREGIKDFDEGTENYTTAVFVAMFPQFDSRTAFRAVPGLLATLAVFSRNLTPTLATTKAAPLLKMLHLALKDVKVDGEFINAAFSPENLVHQKHAAKLRNLVSGAWDDIQGWIDDPDNYSWSTTKKTPRSPTLSRIHGDLRKAYAAGDRDGVTRIWNQLNRQIANYSQLEAELQNDPAHLDFWFFIWCALGRESMLPETEDLLKRMEHQPTVKTYTAMMHGWKMAKKYDKISLLWDRLHSSGIRLDQHIWTERISSLIDLGKLQEAIALLAKMMKAWKANPKREVEPTIEVFNAAFDGVIRRDKAAAFEILGWAGQEGVKPDVVTFNILLRESAVQEGEMPRLLKEMKERGIEPDEGTFTIIMDVILASMAGSSDGELVSSIDGIFNIVDTSGLKLNQEMYAKILHVVASRLDGSDEAIEAVLKNMADRGHNKISPHMVLILLQRLMRQRGANSATIDTLLNGYGFTSIASGDQRLWEHVIRSYANVGDSANALRVYEDLAKAGRPATSLHCLKDLLQVLLNDSRNEDADRVVERTLEDMRRRSVDERGWRHRFWHIAYHHGLLRGKTIPVDLMNVLAF